MARKQRVSRGKAMRPNFFVFCEGETEEVYIGILRAHYRAPIQIITKKTLLNITPALINRIKANYICTKNDRTFLMYDLDVATVLERLKKIPNAILLPVLSRIFDCANDIEAIRVMQALFPGKQIIPIYAQPLIKDGGALHCITWEYIPNKQQIIPSL